MRASVSGALLLLTFTLLSACVVGPQYETPRVAEPSRFEAPLTDLAFDQAVEPELIWWDQLDDPVLSDLMRQALDENLSLEASAARLRAARARLGIRRWERFPTGDLTGAVRDQKEGTQPSDAVYEVSLGASWELDLFGRVRRSIEAAEASWEERQQAHRASTAALTAEVGGTYLELRGAQALLEVAHSSVTIQEEGLSIIEALREAGRVTALEVAQTRERIETVRAAIPEFEAQELTARYRLAVLLALEPTELDAKLGTAPGLPRFPVALAIGDPAALLRRRPDVRAAERRLAAATAEIGVATADLFPRVSLNASFLSLSTDLDELGQDGASSRSFGPFLRWSPFDLGRVQRRIEASEAEAEALLAEYRQAALRALEETESALVRLDRFHRRQVHRVRAETAARDAWELARLRFEAGLTSYQTVLDAEDRRLIALDRVTRGEVELGLTWIELYRALGGGWTN